MGRANKYCLSINQKTFTEPLGFGEAVNALQALYEEGYEHVQGYVMEGGKRRPVTDHEASRLTCRARRGLGSRARLSKGL